MKRNKHGILLDELIFFITYRCHFSCRTCFYVEAMAENTIKHTEELTLEEIAKVSSSLGRLRRLLISGGEPFLRDDLPEICRLFYRQNKIQGIHLPTNGFDGEKVCAYTYKILDQCPEAKLIVSLPLDGLEDTHDKIKGVAGSFKKVIETAKRLASLKEQFNNLKLYIITVVNNLNIGEIVELSEFVKNNLPVDGHGPSPLRGKSFDNSLLPPSPEQWQRLSEKLISYHVHWNKKAKGSSLTGFLTNNKIKYLYKLYGRVLQGGRLPFNCPAGKQISVLEPNGDVRLCELTETVGNIRDFGYNFKKALLSDKAREVGGKIKTCACTHACFLELGIKANPLIALRAYGLGS